MTLYKYETHLHTSEVSLCSVASAAALVQCYRKLGYTGIFVTDHFLVQETPAQKEWPWMERIDYFCRGYEAAQRHGRKVGLDVFFGWEGNEGTGK